MTREVTKVIEVPYMEDVKTRVRGYGVQTGTGKKTVSVKKMVPVTKYKEVEHSTVEVQEEKKIGTHMVWKQVPSRT